MLQCNLRVIMARKRITATKISADTRISRVTLGALINNQAKGVQFETLNTLCSYLGIQPGELFEFVPFDVVVKQIQMRSNRVCFEVRDGARVIECSVPMVVDITKEKVELDSEAHVFVPSCVFLDVGAENDQQTELFMRYYGVLSSELKMHVETQIENAVVEALMEDQDCDLPDAMMPDLQVEIRMLGTR